MHIAVLDDNVASRKHMERLLSRISDSNKKNGQEGYYIDSYGAFDSLHSKLAMYDAIFIDMVESDMKGHEIAEHVLKSGIQGKIILCTSAIDYKNLISNDLSSHYLFIDKPIKNEELIAVLDICEEKKNEKEPQIEIRTKDETLYVKYNEFLYAKALVAGKTTIVLEGRDDTIYYKDFTLVKKSITEYPFMIAINKDTIVSTYHIQKIGAFSVTMDDGTTFPVSLKMSSMLKKIPTGLSVL